MRNGFAATSAVALYFLASGAWAQQAAPTVVVPPSSVADPADAGKRAHTNYRYLALPLDAAPPALYGVNPTVPPGPGNFETPASLACIYGLVAKTLACNPRKVTANVVGGSKAIAIVDAFDNPTVLADLKFYAAQFGLPAITSSNFQVVFANGTRPPRDDGWGLEIALDVEMAHALAPKAKMILVEAASNSFADLLFAEKKAAALVAAAGGGEVSNSWGSRRVQRRDQPVVHLAVHQAEGGVLRLDRRRPVPVLPGGGAECRGGRRDDGQPYRGRRLHRRVELERCRCRTKPVLRASVLPEQGRRASSALTAASPTCRR